MQHIKRLGMVSAHDAPGTGVRKQEKEGCTGCCSEAPLLTFETSRAAAAAAVQHAESME